MFQNSIMFAFSHIWDQLHRNKLQEDALGLEDSESSAWPHKAWAEYHRNGVFSREPSLLKQEGTKSKMVIEPNFNFFQTGSIFKVSRNSKMAPLAGNWVFNTCLIEDIY